MSIDELRKILEEKGMDWLITAMVDGSIGYHSPNGAKCLIERALKGEIKDWCERCLCCYRGDLMAMIESDIKKMLIIEKHNPGRAQRLMDATRKILAARLTTSQEMTMSALYPTMGV